MKRHSLASSNIESTRRRQAIPKICRISATEGSAAVLATAASRIFSGLPPLIGPLNWFNWSQSGDGLMNRNVFALFGAVALLLTATVALTLSRAAPFASGIGSLKCYDVTGAIEKPCNRQPRH